MYQKTLKQSMMIALFSTVMLGSAFALPKDSQKAEAATKTDKLFAGGKGTKSKPYQIKTAKQFANIGKNKTTLKKYYVLKKNINFKNKTVKNIGSVTMAQMGEGNMSYAFSGSLDGKGYTLSNIKVKQETDEIGAGLFEVSTGTVKNLTVKNITTTGTANSMFSFDGNKISGYDASGTELFSHEYTFDSYSEASGMGLYAYRTKDADAGEFTYIVLAADTPASTYHIEFRYGDDLNALNSYATGKYAY